MLKHIVLFTIKSEYSSDKKNKIAHELVQKLLNLKNDIPHVIDIEAGVNVSTRPTAMDVALISDFENQEELQKYRVHPAHEEVMVYIRSITEKTTVVDYEY